MTTRLSKFNRVLSVDTANRTALVQPGVTNLAISEAGQHAAVNTAMDNLASARYDKAATVDLYASEAGLYKDPSDSGQYGFRYNKYVDNIGSGVDFRAKNYDSIENLEENSIDFYASVKSLYLQDRKRRILNSDQVIDTLDDSDWDEIETN